MSEAETRGPAGLLDEDGRLKERLVLGGEGRSQRVALATLGKLPVAMAVVAAGVIASFTVPALEFARPWRPGDPAPFWNVLGRPFESEAVAETRARAAEVDAIAQEVLASDITPPPPRPEPPILEVAPGDKLPAYKPHPDDGAPVVQSLELFKGDELDRFYGALARSDAAIAGARTRVVHWGDSAIGIDGIPGAIRERMQARFGDAGHGFHLMAPPNTSYRHRAVKFRHNDSWQDCFIIFKCASDGRYGLGGTSFRSAGGAQSSFAPHPERSGGKVSRFDVYYAAGPRGGQLRLRVDKDTPIVLDTAADVEEDRFHALDVADGPHKLEVRAGGRGRVRVYGVSLERDVPGVIWDSLALVGAFTSRMLEYNPAHLRAQLERAAPDLVVLTFGGNDMIRRISMQDYADEYRDVVQRVRKARPEMDCLIMTPLDHGERKGVRIVSRPIVAEMVAAQREVARSEGCAFFDTFAAMGGEGSAGRWFKRKPRLIGGDLSHATGKGHQVIGEFFYRALMEGYVAYRGRADAQEAP